MLYVYSLWPIDHGWQFLTPLNKLAEEIGAAEAIEKVRHGHTLNLDHILTDQLAADWQAAQSAAREYGWEGDCGRGPYLFWIPTDYAGFVHAFAFKQQNNGMTFIVSPHRLQWLEARAESHGHVTAPAATS